MQPVTKALHSYWPVILIHNLVSGIGVRQMGLDAISASAAGEKKSAEPEALVDFVISRGQEESVFHTDGTVLQRKAEGKIDPNCKNSVKTPDGSEQRFDSMGLCKLKGQVKWGKSSEDGVMDITVGGAKKVKIQLDRNWQLLNVRSEHTQYKRPEIEAKLPEVPKPAAPAPEIRVQDHKGWKPIYPSENKPKEAPGIERVKDAAPRDPARQQRVHREQPAVIPQKRLGPPLNILPR